MRLAMEDDTFEAIMVESGKQRFRKFPPVHYTFEIKSFSSLLKNKVEKCETKDFEAGGYKWRMVLYPNGKKKDDGSRYISLFLAITEPADVSLGWEVNVTATFFVFDAIRDRYLVVQDADQLCWRFRKFKAEWGFVDFISHQTLHDLSNGFLVDDRIILGVDVFVMKIFGVGESLSFVEEPKSGLFTWKIDNFSALEHVLYSEVFTVEGTKWKLQLFPKGDSDGSGTYLSLFLFLDDSATLQNSRSLYAKWLLRIKDHTNCNHFEIKDVEHWFRNPNPGFGSSEFMLLSTLKDPSKGYLLNDCLIIEAEFNLVSVSKDLS